MASSDDCTWETEIIQRLDTTLKDKTAVARVLYYLVKESEAYKDCLQSRPAWRILKSVLTSSDVVFQLYAERLADDTKTAENDENFRKTLNVIYTQMMDASEKPLPDDTFKKFDVARIKDLSVVEISGSMGLARALSLIPVSSQKQILELIPKIISNQQVICTVDNIVGAVNKVGGNVVMVALAVVWLSWDVMKSLYRWWKGEITGKRCCKIIVDSTFMIGAGVAGSIGGAALGALGGPIGTLAGSVVGGILSAQAVNFLSDRLTQSLFGIPKDEALENAYKYFGVKTTASNDEINKAYRKQCLKHHPDKGGKIEDFHLVQFYMGTIKVAKGEQYY